MSAWTTARVSTYAAAYGMVVAAHYHAYTRWSDEQSVNITILHGISIAGHILSCGLCALTKPLLGARVIVFVNACHNYLIHIWNTVLATTALMSRVRLQGVNDMTCTLALCCCAAQCGLRSRPWVSICMASLLLVHVFLFLGQALRAPAFDRLVIAFYPETVVKEGGPLYSCFNLLRWCAVQSDLLSSSVVMASLVQHIRASGKQ